MFADVPGYGSGSTPYYWVWTNDLTFFLKSVEYSTSQIKTLVPWIDDNLACLCSNINLGFLQKEMNHLSEWDKHHKVIRVIRVRGILWNKGLRPATLFKKRLWHRCFLVTFAKFLRTPFFTKHIQWLLLTFAPIKISYSNTVSNAWALICLVSWRMVVENSGAKSFILTCTFLRIIAFFIKI